MPILRNPRHERFAQLRAGGARPSDAYRSLGYSKEGAAQSAAKLSKRADVRERIDEILAESAKTVAAEVAFDQKRVLQRLDVLSRKAEELKQISAAVRCEELIGKERGMFVERSLRTVRSVGDMTVEELEALVSEAEAYQKQKREKDAALGAARKDDLPN